MQPYQNGLSWVINIICQEEVPYCCVYCQDTCKWKRKQEKLSIKNWIFAFLGWVLLTALLGVAEHLIGSKQFTIYFLGMHRNIVNSHAAQHHWSDFNSTQDPIITKSTANNTRPHRKSWGKTKCKTPSPIIILLLYDVHNVFHDISQMCAIISSSLK